MTDSGVDPWTATVDDARRTASELTDDGVGVLTAIAGSSGPIREGTPGFAHIADGNAAAELAARTDVEFTDADVFTATSGGNVYVMTVIRSRRPAVAVVVAGSLSLDTVDRSKTRRLNDPPSGRSYGDWTDVQSSSSATTIRPRFSPSPRPELHSDRLPGMHRQRRAEFERLAPDPIERERVQHRTEDELRLQ